MAKDYTIKTIFQGVDKTSKVLGKMQAKVASFTHSASMKFRKLDRALSGVASGITKGLKTGLAVGTVGAIALGGALSKVMEAYSKFENAEAAFTPLMGGVEGARALVERLKKEAATTPFEFENLANTAAQLLPMMNKDIDKTAETMRMMGDVAGGNVQKMESITRGYMKALLKGKVDMESLNMIAEAGVPIFDQLAQAMGKKTGTQFFKMISAGRVKTKDLNKAFKRMTSEGGLFYNGMDLASATLSGRISTLKDEATGAAAELGGVLAPTIKDIVDKSIAFIPVIKQWVVQNKDLIRTKVAEFMKKVPGYFSQMYSAGKQVLSVLKPIVSNFISLVKWIGPGNIAKGIAYFYGLVAAIKALNGVMTITNKLANMNLGVMTKGVGVLGKFNLGLSAIQVFLASYVIGTLLHDNFVEPLMKAWDLQKKIVGEAKDTARRDATKRNSAQLKKDIEVQKKANAIESKAIAGSTQLGMSMGFVPSSFFGGGLESKNQAELKKLENALAYAKQRENISKYSGPGMSYADVAPWEIGAPEVSTTETSNETKIISEVTIRDETGKARVTRGKNGVGGLQLIHTGGGR